MRRGRKFGAAASLLCIAAFISGCGGSGSNTESEAVATSESPPATTTKAHVPKAELVELSSPVVANLGPLPSRYTCAGANVSPPLRWKGIPPGTAELLLVVLDLEPVNGNLFIDWAVGGLSPHSHGIASGKLPPGAVEGTNSDGRTRYTLCFKKGETGENAGHVVAVLFALPKSLSLESGFNATEARTLALSKADYEGFLQFTAKRR